jgi:hypothetical protein
MSRTTLFFSSTFVLIFITGSHAELKETTETVTIPLEKIWAYDMPGTRELSAASKDGKYVYPEGPLVYEILKLFGKRMTAKTPGPGFALQGSGIDALEALHAYLSSDKPPSATFPANSEVSIFFFTYPTSGYYVYIRRVERRGNLIEITYQFHPHLTRNVTAHFALIPLGRMSKGDYQVKIVQDRVHSLFKVYNMEPPEPKVVTELICKDYSFGVVDAQPD